ncbi:MAG: twin-arginine translocation signal domain-containing protein [Balneolaceae bacterium]
MTKRTNTRRDFLKKSALTAAGFTMAPGMLQTGFGMNVVRKQKPRVAFLANIYRNRAHADVIGTKLFIGIPADDGLIPPEVDIVSMWIDQIGSNDTGVRIADMNGVPVYPTIADALTLGGEELAVDAVIYVGEHGDYARSRLGVKMYPRLNYIEQVFRVFDASNRSVPVFHDKHLAYSWLDSKWIYDRARELNVPMMAGSSLPYAWRDPGLIHPLGTEITEAVAIGYASMDAYGHHVLEILQCMVERRAGGETGVASIQGLEGDAVWQAMDEGRISEDLVHAACDSIRDKETGNMREIVSNPRALIIQYNDGLKGAILMLDEYVNNNWAYAAEADGETVATEFVLNSSVQASHFSYLTLNIQKFITSGGKPPVPIERNLLTSGMIDMGIRSIAEGETVRKTPFLNIRYTAEDGYAILPPNPRPTGASTGPWPPEGYEEYDFIIPDSYRS